jgi:lysophospholipase L1-like esterase
MEEQIQKHVWLYPSDSESHPQAAGYGAIARAVHEAVRSLR